MSSRAIVRLLNMRTTLACQWCRSSKIKCQHNGTAPCWACASRPGRECVLSRPGRQNKLLHASQRTCQRLRSGFRHQRIVDRGGERDVLQHADRQESADHRLNITPSPAGIEGQAGSVAQSENPLLGIAREIVLTATQTFIRQFTMFSFLHEPTLFDVIHGRGELDIRFCGILALCARFIPALVDQHGGRCAASDYFASYLRRNITCEMAASDDIARSRLSCY